MKKLDLKSILVGAILGTVGLSTVFAAGGIRSATFSSAKVTLDGVSVSLTNPMVSIVQDGEKDARLYMPVRELLEYIGYTVSWQDGNIHIVSNIDVKIVENNLSDTNPSRKHTQIVEIDIPKINADEYIALDLCDLQGDDKITFDITSNGKGVLFAGFMKDKDSFGTTYFGSGDFYGIKKGRIESTFSVNGFEGKYYFFVKNNGKEIMENIKGTVTIERK